jgi:hypothetical protein
MGLKDSYKGRKFAPEWPSASRCAIGSKTRRGELAGRILRTWMINNVARSSVRILHRGHIGARSGLGQCLLLSAAGLGHDPRNSTRN